MELGVVEEGGGARGPGSCAQADAAGWSSTNAAINSARRRRGAVACALPLHRELHADHRTPRRRRGRCAALRARSVTCSRTAFSCRRTRRLSVQFAPSVQTRSSTERQVGRARRADRAVGRAAGGEPHALDPRRQFEAGEARQRQPIVGLRRARGAPPSPTRPTRTSPGRAAAAASRPSAPDVGARHRPAGIRRGTRTGLAASRGRHRRAGGAPGRRLGRRTRRSRSMRPRSE